MSYKMFSDDTIDKYSTHMITSQRYHTAPFGYLPDIYQRFKPNSGNFIQGNNFFGDLECVNNQTGRAFYANPCGYWKNSKDQFNSGTILETNNDQNMLGALFPIGKISDNKVMTNPNDRIVFGYARIGEEIRNR